MYEGLAGKDDILAGLRLAVGVVRVEPQFGIAGTRADDRRERRNDRPVHNDDRRQRHHIDVEQRPLSVYDALIA